MSEKKPKQRPYASIEEEDLNDDPVLESHGGDLPDDDGRPADVSEERRRALEEAAAAAAGAELEGLD